MLRKEAKFVVIEGGYRVRGAFNLGIAHSWPTSANVVFNIRLLMRVHGDLEKLLSL
uniref:Uncharacterized protein n=1 Tax=Ralstonia syzygii R24 TaxID=907261 RepID=G3A2Z1_9RALS|nr:hypothetical protein RALSY_20164 [Ralstonia syzygii R24]